MPSRVSTNQIYSGSLANVTQARNREVETGEKAQTQKAINRPSDDPASWVLAQNLKDSLSSGEKIERNAQIAMHFMSAAETAMTHLQEYMQRAYELAIGAADSTSKRESVLLEVKGLWASVLQAMNSRYGDRSLFAGFQTQSSAFDREGKYLGDNGRISIHVASQSEPVPINFSGEQLFLGHGLHGGVSFPEIFQGFIERLENNDGHAIANLLPSFLQANEQISLGRAEIGGHMNRVSRALEFYGVEKLGNIEAISKLEDVDVYKAFSDMARDQAIFHSSLATNKKLLEDAPVDILFK